MNRVLIAMILIVAGLLGLGFYLKWFGVASESDANKGSMTFTMDKDKIKEDKDKVVDKAADLGKQLKDKVVASGPAAPSDTSMDGTVVSASADKLTMADKSGKEHSHALAAAVKTTLDGKTAKAADLKSGLRIRVTTDKAAPHAAIRIEALDVNRDFDKG